MTKPLMTIDVSARLRGNTGQQQQDQLVDEVVNEVWARALLWDLDQTENNVNCSGLKTGACS